MGLIIRQIQILQLWHFGAKPNKYILDSLGLNINKWGYIDVNENQETSIKGVFAAGDLIYAKSTVAWAARSGRDAAECIYKELS